MGYMTINGQTVYIPDGSDSGAVGAGGFDWSSLGGALGAGLGSALGLGGSVGSTIGSALGSAASSWFPAAASGSGAGSATRSLDQGLQNIYNSYTPYGTSPAANSLQSSYNSWLQQAAQGGGGQLASGSAGQNAFSLNGTGMQNGQVLGVSSSVQAPAAGLTPAQQAAQAAQTRAVMQRLQGMQDTYQQQLDAAKNQQLGIADSMGSTLNTQAEQAAAQEGAKLQQNLTSRGLGNSTITASVDRGVQRDLDQAKANIADQQSRLRLSILQNQNFMPQQPNWNMWTSLLMQPGALTGVSAATANPSSAQQAADAWNASGIGGGLTSPTTVTAQQMAKDSAAKAPASSADRVIPWTVKPYTVQPYTVNPYRVGG